MPRNRDEFCHRFPKTRIAIIEQNGRARAQSDSILRVRRNSFSFFDRSNGTSEDKLINLQDIKASLDPTSAFINVKCLSNLPLSAVAPECLALLIFWRDAGELLFATGTKDQNILSLVKACFWRNQNTSSEFYRNISPTSDQFEKSFLFRIQIRGKFLVGVVQCQSVKHASAVVTGKIAWAVKDLLY